MACISRKDMHWILSTRTISQHMCTTRKLFSRNSHLNFTKIFDKYIVVDIDLKRETKH